MGYLERFADYRDLWLRQGVGVMYRRFLTDEQVSARMLRRPDGERRLTNLLHLGEQIHEAAATHESPDALLRWLATQRRDGSADEVAQLRLESDRNLVQIITIHKAKGLEFPIVFCPFLWDGNARFGGPKPEGREYHDADGAAVIDFRLDDEIAPEKARIDARDEAGGRGGVAASHLRGADARGVSLLPDCRHVHEQGFAESHVAESTKSLLNWLVAGGRDSPEALVRRQALAGRHRRRMAEPGASGLRALTSRLAPLPDAARHAGRVERARRRTRSPRWRRRRRSRPRGGSAASAGS